MEGALFLLLHDALAISWDSTKLRVNHSHSHQISDCTIKHSITSRCINTADILFQTVHIKVRSPTINMLQTSSILVGYSWGDELLHKDVAKKLVYSWGEPECYIWMWNYAMQYYYVIYLVYCCSLFLSVELILDFYLCPCLYFFVTASWR